MFLRLMHARSVFKWHKSLFNDIPLKESQLRASSSPIPRINMSSTALLMIIISFLIIIIRKLIVCKPAHVRAALHCSCA